MDEPIKSRYNLPRRCVAALDAEGAVGGKTWRQMGGSNEEKRALNWFFHKRGLLPGVSNCLVMPAAPRYTAGRQINGRARRTGGSAE